MPIAVNDWEEHVGARLLEFLNSSTRWNRSLWSVGLVLMLHEVLEASQAVQEGILAPEALGYIVSGALKAAVADPGIGDRSRLKVLQEALQPKMRFQGLNYFALRDFVIELESDYLSNWTAYLAAPSDTPNAERAARSIASNLLDGGFNNDYLHRWWTFRLKHEVPRRQLYELVAEAHALQLSGPRAFEALVVFERVPQGAGRPAGWIDAPAVAAWLRKHKFESLRQYGGIVLTLTSFDAEAAADKATEIVESLAARARIVITGELRPHPKVWIANESRPFDIRPRHRGLNVGALMREKVVYNIVAQDNSVDAAFEILAQLQASSPVPAISAGWAAVEALLSEPNDRGGAAERLAGIVACSFPRAELTTLSYVVQKENKRHAPILAEIKINRDRARHVAQVLLTDENLSLQHAVDRAAVARLRRILQSPAQALEDIQQHVAGTFRRMYRQRNLVLHGGRTNPVALRSCLRTCAPLVGAGMDRIAHKYYVDGTLPLVTAAQARNAILRVVGRNPTACADLLK